MSTALLLLASLALPQIDPDHSAPVQPPRLVLQITVDQMRGDLLDRVKYRLGEGGFRRLLSDGSGWDPQREEQ